MVVGLRFEKKMSIVKFLYIKKNVFFTVESMFVCTHNSTSPLSRSILKSATSGVDPN